MKEREGENFQWRGSLFNMWPLCTLPLGERDWNLPRKLQPGRRPGDQRCCKMGPIQKAAKGDDLQTSQRDLAMFCSPGNSPKKVSRMASLAEYGKQTSKQIETSLLRLKCALLTLLVATGRSKWSSYLILLLKMSPVWMCGRCGHIS